MLKDLINKGIDTRIAYPKPVYDQELYKAGIAKFRKYTSPIAEKFTSQVINLPIYPSLGKDQINYIIQEIMAELN